MEFNIEVFTTLLGEIKIEDFSKEYGLYLDEDSDVTLSYDYYKYSDCVSVNSIIKNSIDKIELLGVTLNDHTTDSDSCVFNVDHDGYYTIDHLIVPNKKWYLTASDEYKQYYSTIYIIDNGKAYKELNGKLLECTLKEMLERNNEGTTIKRCKVDVFYTGNLQHCYIEYCKSLFESQLGKCNSLSDDIVFARDFIWMTLNIIDYLVGFKQYLEAERLLESFTSCNGYCSGKKRIKTKSGCGCSKT